MVKSEIIPREEFSANGLREIPGGPILRLVIQDNGPGIDDEYLSRVFDPFFSTRRELNASGLGLTAVRTLMPKRNDRVVITATAAARTTATRRSRTRTDG